MNTNLYLDIGSYTYNVEITRKMRKSISLQVIDKYKLEVKSPFFVLDETISDFIRSRAIWINNQNKKLIDSQIIIKDGEKIPFLGSYLTIKLSDNYKKATLSGDFLNIPQHKDSLETITKWYKKQAKELILNEVEFYAKSIGVKYSRVFIKAQKTRWGSCSARGNLNFNWKILLTNRECLKYLIIHELCHLIEMNHSSRFWSLVAKYDPDFIENRRTLKNFSALLSNSLFNQLPQ